jgi:hypothetical protein
MHSRSLLVITVSLIAGGGILIGLLDAPPAAAPHMSTPTAGAPAAPAPAPAPAAPNPLASATPVAGPAQALSGEILERLDAGSYVYLRVRPADAGAETWIVLPVLEAPPADATAIRVRVMRRVERFHSRRLGREFSELLFAARDAALSSPKGVR